MKVVGLETYLVNIPYTRTEVSSIVNRSGVTSVIIKLTTDDGLVGWGEACSGADVYSIEAAIKAMFPFIKDRSPWDSAELREDAFLRGLWALRVSTGNYAWAAIDMALWSFLRFFVGGLRTRQSPLRCCVVFFMTSLHH